MRLANTMLAIFCGIISLFWGIVWLNNVYLSWIKRIWMMGVEAASQTRGLFPPLDLFSIDHSTVSTFIPFFGFAWITWRFYTIGRCTKSETQLDLRKEFPYFQGYNEWMVSLGLMGTVWGLIMIGYFPNLDNLKITDLIGALRTALFSTLVALFWVYIVVLRIIRPGMQLFVRKYLGQAETPVSASSLHTAIETFANNLEGLNSVLADTTQRMDEFRKQVTAKKLEEVEKFFTATTENLPKIKQSCDQSLGTLEALRLLLNEQLAASNKHSGYLDEIKKSQSEQHRYLSAMNESLVKKEARDANARKRLGTVMDIIKGYSEE